MNKDEIKLIACPFDGGEAVEREKVGYKSGMYKYSIGCRTCCADSGAFKTLEEARRHWSIRYPQPYLGKLEIWKDDDLEGFAAWFAGSTKDKPLMVLNLGGSLSAAIENGIKPKELIIENLMHEFGHFLEELFNKEFNEVFIEKVIESYRVKYGGTK